LNNNNTNTTFINFGTFSRRFDKLHNDKNTIQLQASVAAIRAAFIFYYIGKEFRKVYLL
jgi:hypothetical protein